MTVRAVVGIPGDRGCDRRYVVGGWNGTHNLDSIERRVQPPVPRRIRRPCSVGYDVRRCRLDRGAAQWAAAESLNSARSSVSCCLLNDKVYADRPRPAATYEAVPPRTVSRKYYE